MIIASCVAIASGLVLPRDESTISSQLVLMLSCALEFQFAGNTLEWASFEREIKRNGVTYTAFVQDGVVVFIVCSRSSFHVMRDFGCAVKDETKIFQGSVVLRFASLGWSGNGS